MQTRNRDCGHFYLIASKDYLVTCDICDTILDFDPAAEISVQKEHEAALLVLSRYRRIAVAFMECGSEAVTRSKIDKTVVSRGGKLVLMGGAAEAELDMHSPQLQWPVLARPISTRMIMSHLPRDQFPGNKYHVPGLVS
ncbi:hypothetical protein KUV26_09970 [Leisingera daeponensis]|uniref:Uncharacterized protein n=1 Tax=Leisingera daeponensis TaxID=405746 RepID=A0ABS7NEX1_9RHOB|nr:hypothetical protein [Leisingera daeponensis]MBY6056138.1 hypothetical protein [Leisingera daeponensis]MBY6139759.1 hypothetical protein [Leisingera daeponensis]